MNRYCVIGEKLSHTRSPQIHDLFFTIRGIDGSYDVREIKREDIGSCRDLLMQYDGVNVTIPYKTDVMKNLDAISEEAKRIGAVNTLKRVGDRLEGYNSDPYGFAAMLASRGVDPSGKTVVVLGWGGAARSVVHALEEIGAQVTVVSRDPAKVDEKGVRAIDYARLKEECASGRGGYLLVNCTPVGMYPKEGTSPVNESVISRFDALADIVYNPMYTQFLRIGAKLGKRCVGGLYMLVAQAMKSQSIWRDEEVDDGATATIFKKLSFDEAIGGGLNVYLTGVMSCGKSTLGKKLAAALGRKFVDMDDYIVSREGRSIPEMFDEGEETFRDAESRAVYELSLEKGLVVATGGGCILRDKNADVLLLSGATVFVKRDIDKIIATADCSGRPLLKDGADRLRGIYAARKDRYFAGAQVVLDNDGDVKEGLEKLLSIVGKGE